MTERPDPTTPAREEDESEPTEAGVDPGLRAELASDPEVAAMVRALTKGEDATEPSDTRTDVGEASRNVGTGTDR
jgi:hypothetical protein